VQRIESDSRELILHDYIFSSLRFGLVKPAEKFPAIGHIIYFLVNLTQNNYITKEVKPAIDMRYKCSIFVSMCNIICINKLSSFDITFRGKDTERFFILLNKQRDAALSSRIYYSLQDYCICFGCFLHPLSGVR
jgi:hypothetical protein